MRVAIRGYKILDDIKEILNQDEIQIVCVVDLNSDLWGKLIDNIQIISPMKAFKYFMRHEIDKIIVNPLLGIQKITDIVNEMQKMGISYEYIRVPKVEDVFEKHKICSQELISTKYSVENFKNLYYLEYHIADDCNLNCAGCSHFSPLVQKKYYPSLESTRRDMNRLKEIIDHIEWIRILGGEPFLNENWKGYIEIIRHCWKYSKLSIVTNGLLLKKLTDEDFYFLKNNNVWIDISLYKPLWNYIDDILIMLNAKDVKYEINGAPIFEFTSVFDINSKDDFVKKRTMCTAPCNNLYKGKMSPCPIMMYTSIFNDYFNTDLPEGQPVDLYDDLDYEKLCHQLKKPMKICQYCNMEEKKPWKQVNKNNCKIEDWIVRN